MLYVLIDDYVFTIEDYQYVSGELDSQLLKGNPIKHNRYVLELNHKFLLNHFL